MLKPIDLDALIARVRALLWPDAGSGMPLLQIGGRVRYRSIACARNSESTRSGTCAVSAAASRTSSPACARLGAISRAGCSVPWAAVSRKGVAQAARRVHARHVYARHEPAAQAVSKVLPSMLMLTVPIAGLLMFALRRGMRPLDKGASDWRRPGAPMQRTRWWSAVSSRNLVCC